MQAAGSRLASRTQQEIQAQRIELKPGLRGTSDTEGRFATELRILIVVVGIALLIAAVNVANLLLARAAARQREIALRFSLGATRARLVGQALMETALLAGAGCVAGIAFAIMPWSALCVRWAIPQ